MPLPLMTERLSLRAPEPGDLDALAAVFTDPEAMRHIGTGAIWDGERITTSHTQKVDRLHERGFTLYTVVRRADDRILGDCGLGIWADTGETEIGWRLAREHWGQGYATEAARAVFDHACGELGLTHLICMVGEANTASWRIAERLGFRLDQEEERYGRPVRRYVWP